MRRTCGWIIKRFGIALLVLAFLFPSLEATSASQEKSREYLEKIWGISEIADLTDTALQGILQETYHGVPYLEWVQLFRCGDEVYELMAQGRDPDALRVALGYGVESTYVEVLTEFGMPGAAAVAKLSARTAQYTLEKFNEAFQKNAFETQLEMYFLARDSGYSFEDVVSRKEGGGIRGPLVTFTDDGWLKVVEDDECLFCKAQPYTPVEFYVIAEAAYTTRTMEASYKGDKEEVKKALYSVIKPQQEKEEAPEISPIEPVSEPILSLDQLTRDKVAEFLSQHPDRGKYWFNITLAWARDITKGSSKIQAVFDELKRQGYIDDYSMSEDFLDTMIVIEGITQKGSQYLKELSEPWLLGQGVDVALCAKKDIRVTGILEEGSKALVEYTWACGRTTPVFDVLRPILTSRNFRSNWDIGLEGVLELLDSAEMPEQEFFALYDDGWRLKEMWEMLFGG